MFSPNTQRYIVEFKIQNSKFKIERFNVGNNMIFIIGLYKNQAANFGVVQPA